MCLFNGMQPALLFCQWNVVIPTGGDCTRANRIGSDMNHIEADLFEQVERMLELLLGLSTKTHDHVSRERNIGP